MTTPCKVVLSVFLGVGGCLCTIYSRAWRAGVASLKFINSDTSSALDDDYMTALVILSIFNTAPLLGGNALLLDVNKCPPSLILDFVLERV